jgi:hypothetical protein
MVAERIGAYETVAGAASVLYNIALDVDEDLGAAADLLRQIADCGAKCANVDKQLYALVAAYEIEVERGDEAAIEILEVALKDFDVSYAGRIIGEGLLPSQVLQLGWQGEFARAHRVLKASGGQQQDAGRRALRWAEISVYAAAACATGDSKRAAAAARRQLRLTPPARVHATRARALLALTSILAGEPQAARSEALSLAAKVPPGSGRLRALVDFVAKLAGWHIGVIDHVEVLMSLETLRHCEFSGLARMLEALPAELVDPQFGDSRKAKSA